jgi:hypothetical protein
MDAEPNCSSHEISVHQSLKPIGWFGAVEVVSPGQSQGKGVPYYL